MAIDWDAILHGPVYRTLGVDCVFTLDGGEILTLTGLDKSAGLLSGKDVETQTIRPACAVRMADLATEGALPVDLKSALLAMSGKFWKVKSIEVRPSPAGEASGEAVCYLHEVSE